MADKVVTFEAAPGPLDNPLKGWCVYADPALRQPHTMTFQYVSWRELEPAQGDYRFAEWERRAWDTPGAAGKRVVWRVYIDYPSLPSGLPTWLKAKGVTATPYKEEGGGESPDYEHPALREGLKRLIAALGARYDKNERVAFVQMGLLGHWGEWHTYTHPELFASDAVQKEVVDAFRRAFPHKKLMARYAKGYVGKQPWIGFHDDYFPSDTGEEEAWYFQRGMRETGRLANWKQAVVGGEMIPNQARKWISDNAGYARTRAMAEAAHFSWIGPYSPASDASTDAVYLGRCAGLARRMGYEYRLTELRHSDRIRRGQPLRFTLRGVNQGVAPFYYPWAAHLALLNRATGRVAAVSAPLASCDIRTWLPGPFTLSGSALFSGPPAPGVYDLALAFMDPWLQKPGIAFANRLKRGEDGWTVLSRVTLTA